MRSIDNQYLGISEAILNSPFHHLDSSRKDAEGRPLRMKSVFGAEIVLSRKDLEEDFPLLNCKKVNFEAVREELFWFLSGDTDCSNMKTKIWDKDSYRHFVRSGIEMTEEEYLKKLAVKRNFPKPDSYIGRCGLIYGHQWRSFEGNTDQIAILSKKLSDNPFRRDLIVNSWNPGDIANERLALAPCHVMFQIICMSDESGQTFCGLEMFQRSADWYLGVPFNIASYALLLRIVCGIYGFVPAYLRINFGNAHLYPNHEEAVRAMLENWSSNPSSQKCRLDFSNSWNDLATFADSREIAKESSCLVSGYFPTFSMKAEMIAKVYE